MHEPAPTIYGLMAEFADPRDVLDAARRAHAAGYRKMDAYTPIPVEGLSQALGFKRTRLPLLTLTGGLIGCLGGFALQYWSSVYWYPMNIGGRPYNSWPAFIPITFELTILTAAFFTVLGMLGLNKLPQPYHPVFNVPQFRLASRDRFFLCIEAADPKFSLDGTRAFLASLPTLGVYEVEP